MRHAFTLVAMCAAVLAAQEFQATFSNDKKNLGVKGSNPYFPLTPAYKLSYRHGSDTDTLTILDKTKVIDGVECRIMEDRENEEWPSDRAFA